MSDERACCKNWETLNGASILFAVYCPWCGSRRSEPVDLTAAARKVVQARYNGAPWELLKEAIGELSDVLGKQ